MTTRDYQMKMETVKKAMTGVAVVLMGSVTLAATATTAQADTTSAQPQMVRNIPASPISETEVNVQPTTTEPVKNVPASPVSETQINVRPASADAQSNGATTQSSASANVNGASQMNNQAVASDNVTTSFNNAQVNAQTLGKPAATSSVKVNANANVSAAKDVAPVALNAAQPVANKAAAHSAVQLNTQSVAFNQAAGQQARYNDNAKANSNHDAAQKSQPAAAMSFGFLGLAGLGMILAKAKKEF